jgi:ribosomal protein S18 acetylase RimI-like enzyme
MDGDDDPYPSYGLNRILFPDKPLFDFHFSSCKAPLSDYTFANTFIWRDCVRLRWQVIRDMLCVFANGDGGLTLVFPPLGPGDTRAAAKEALEICDDYNAGVGRADATRIEYVSAEWLEHLTGEFAAQPMSGDYVYSTRRMIDLDGGDLASKRQARNRFVRRYEPRTCRFRAEHAQQCVDLLKMWHRQHDQPANTGNLSVTIRRQKEELATVEVIRNAEALGLQGMMLYAGDRPAGFTFGEMLDSETCSILIEKTDRELPGSAQYIFSEFCRQFWSHTKWCNVGDDWDVPTLAWTKQSYRPAFRVDKWVLHPVRKTVVAAAQPPAAVAAVAAADGADRASLDDLDDLLRLERTSFSGKLAFNRRQMRYLLRCPRASTHVLRREGRIVAQAVVLRRKTARGIVARLYSIAVDPGHRGAGLGRTLLQNCLEVLKAQNVAAVVLEVDPGNEPAISLYLSMGFHRTRRLPDYYGQTEEGWKMRLDLSPSRTRAPDLSALHLQPR